LGLLISKSLFLQDPIDIIANRKVDTQTIFIFLRMMIIFGVQQSLKP
jgi:hypothetical protein